MTKPLSLRDLSERSGFSDRVLRRFVSEGMPVIRVGRAMYIREDAFETWLLSHETTEYKPYRKTPDEERAI